MSVADMVATLLDRLQHVDRSVDWRGQTNWEKLGSQTHCWRCGGEFGRYIEPGSHVWHHIIPSSEGGLDTVDNRSLLCGDCHNVIHRFYLPTDRIGKKRTRDGKWRRVVKFEEGIEISQDIPTADGSLSSCRECASRGIVDGVSEGYWDGQGMMVFLTCSECGHGFAVPFIGSRNAPKIDPNAVLFAEMEARFAKSAEGFPSDLSGRVKTFGDSLVSAMRNCTRELKKASIIAQLSGISAEELEKKTETIRQKYVDMIKKLLPEAAELEVVCKSYAKESGT
jgi:hypothetical protein